MVMLVRRLWHTFMYDEARMQRWGLIGASFILITLAQGGSTPIPDLPVIPIPYANFVAPLARWVLTGGLLAMTAGRGITPKAEIVQGDVAQKLAQYEKEGPTP